VGADFSFARWRIPSLNARMQTCNGQAFGLIAVGQAVELGSLNSIWRDGVCVGRSLVQPSAPLSEQSSLSQKPLRLNLLRGYLANHSTRIPGWRLVAVDT
jgi:hypothetical protein